MPARQFKSENELELKLFDSSLLSIRMLVLPLRRARLLRNSGSHGSRA